MKTAKDGSKRGRPPLFGEAGRYERVFADVSPAVAAQIRKMAVEEGVSIASVLLRVISEDNFERLVRVPGGERIYAQLSLRSAIHLRGEARRRTWPLSALLGSMAARFFRESRKIAT